MVVTGVDEESTAAAAAATRKQLAFYGSTPAYRPVLDLHGWGDLHKELNTLSKRGAWDDMASLIDDDMLRTFAVVGGIDTVADAVLARFGGLIDRFNVYAPPVSAPNGGPRCSPTSAGSRTGSARGDRPPRSPGPPPRIPPDGDARLRRRC